MTNATKYQLYMGSNISPGKDVTEAAFDKFCRLIVDVESLCYTVLNGKGVWYGTVETCRILEVISLEQQVARRSLKHIAAMYNAEFDQECCLLTEQPVNMSLV